MKNVIFIILLFSSFNLSANSWIYEHKKDEFNDSRKHMAYIKGEGKTYAMVQCDEHSTFGIHFFLNEYLSRKAVNVRWRIDKNTTQTGSWDVSTQGTSVIVKSKFKNQLARNLTRGNNILLEATDYRGTNHRVNFSLNGSSKAISAVFKACNIPMNKITFAGVSDITSNYIDRMGPKSTICLNKELMLSGYQLSKVSKAKTEELYQQAQKFLDQQMAQCPSNGDYLLERQCKDPEEFFFDLYKKAVSKDATIRQECGSLKLEL